MFNRSDYKALAITTIIIILGYASIHLLVYLDEYFKLTAY
jgi:hypothetical protein